MKRAAFIIALLIAAPSAVAGPASAQGFGWPLVAQSPNSLSSGWRDQQNEARDAVRRGRHVSLGQVLQTLRRRTPGRQLDAGLEQRGGRTVYRVRWAADDGRRIDYLVDAETGAIVRAEGE
jgi:uncharacterized membrane protein YkoI